jgi:hypothetical protein
VLFAYGFVALVLLVFCVVDVVTSPRESVRTLPKPLWLLVVLPPLLGPAAWFLAGRPRRGAAGQPKAAPGAPDDDEDFLRELRRRAEEQRRRARDPRDD